MFIALERALTELARGESHARQLEASSPFFKLPRALRDRVYEYYAYEEEGYFYDTTTYKLQIRGGRPFLVL
jgi:hypothetical protein